MTGFFDRLRGRTAPERPAPPVGTVCQFREAWQFSSLWPFFSNWDPDIHEGTLRGTWFTSAYRGPPAAFTLCQLHSVDVARFAVLTNHTLTVP